MFFNLTVVCLVDFAAATFGQKIHSMGKTQAIHAAMERLEQALRQARGRNAYRGRAILQPDQRRILLEAEVRGSAPASRWYWVVLTVDDDPAKVSYGEYTFADIRHVLGDWAQLDAFLDQLLAHLRGEQPHIRTYMHRTEYK